MNNHQIASKREKLIQYIRSHPGCTCLDIKRNTKIKVERIYPSLKDAYRDANVEFSKSLRKRNLQKQKWDVIHFIQNHPECTVSEIRDEIMVNVARVFGGIENAYQIAGVPYQKKEITSGVRNPDVVRRYIEFEKRIKNQLSTIGEVMSKVRTKAGIADCLFKYQGTWFVVEIKDFRGISNITMSEIKQIAGYMRATKINKGLLVCPKTSFPKRKNSRNVYIDGLDIKIVSEEDLGGL